MADIIDEIIADLSLKERNLIANMAEYDIEMRCGNHFPKRSPEPTPRDFGRGHEGIVAFPANAGKTEKTPEAAQQV